MFAFMTCTVEPLPSVMVSFPSAALTVKVAPLTVLTAPGWIWDDFSAPGTTW